MDAEQPLISILTPVLDPDPAAFERCIESVISQTDDSWQWCIVDNGSTDPRIVERLRRLAAESPRVSLHSAGSNLGIAAGTNTALASATGEYCTFLDHDDELATDAVAVIHEATRGESAGFDIAYSDEEILNAAGEQVALMDKPAWSPTRLRSQMYCGHLLIVRRTLLNEIGGLDPQFDGSQDYDLILRASERTDSVIHIPRVLYSWRAGENSTALDPEGKPWAYAAGIRAVQAHCDRVGIQATVEATDVVGVHRLQRHLAHEPLVSIIIPTAGSMGLIRGERVSMVQRCIESILESTTYSNFEIVCIVDERWRGESSPQDDIEVFADPRVRWHSDSGDFNFSRKVNVGAFHARGTILVLLNDDTEIMTSDWLEVMLGLLEEGDVGAVGAALLNADETTQHAGQYLSEMPHHILYGIPFSLPGPMSCLRTERECAGVTAACLMTRRDVFESVGGFCELLSNNYNDVDFCLKVRQRAMRVVWTPWAQLWHYESTSRLHFAKTNDVTRSNLGAEHEQEFLRRRWKFALQHDRYISDSLRVDRDRGVAYPLTR